MFSLFAPKHVQQGRQFVKDAQKLLAYKRDLWSPAQVEEFEGKITHLQKAVRAGQSEGIDAAAKELDTLCGKLMPVVPDAGWRENCEVFLVAIVVALGVRTYFLQPFTIPTGSMQPTLNGIIGHPTKEEPPNFATRILQTAVFGRGWVNTPAVEDGSVADYKEVTRFLFMTYTNVYVSPVEQTPDGPRIVPDKDRTRVYQIHAPSRTLESNFKLYIGKMLKQGDPIARGYVETGDHVFVDKVTYNFRTPRRGDVFVFSTEDIPMKGINGIVNAGPPPRPPSQFYIKRLAGLPGDAMRVDPPELFVNGALATGPGFARVMAAKGDYHGYSNVAEYESPTGMISQQPMTYLNSPNATYSVPEHCYWAMGDNSYHSADSRDWGTVPEHNIMGRGIFVYWPFFNTTSTGTGSHWGPIR